jgi:hypothetical protein
VLYFVLPTAAAVSIFHNFPTCFPSVWHPSWPLVTSWCLSSSECIYFPFTIIFNTFLAVLSSLILRRYPFTFNLLFIILSPKILQQVHSHPEQRSVGAWHYIHRGLGKLYLNIISWCGESLTWRWMLFLVSPKTIMLQCQLWAAPYTDPLIWSCGYLAFWYPETINATHPSESFLLWAGMLAFCVICVLYIHGSVLCPHKEKNKVGTEERIWI